MTGHNACRGKKRKHDAYQRCMVEKHSLASSSAMTMTGGNAGDCSSNSFCVFNDDDNCFLMVFPSCQNRKGVHALIMPDVLQSYKGKCRYYVRDFNN